MQPPPPRGPLSAALADVLAGEPVGRLVDVPVHSRDALTDGDLQLALACCYELHYDGFGDAADGLEWDVDVLGFRARLEAAFESSVHELVPEPAVATPAEPADVSAALAELVARDDGPSLSRYVLREATVDEVRDLLVQRSVYQLKEADPHSWAVPRLRGAAKTALLEIQTDEYGAGDPNAMHSTLFARAMTALELDPTYGAYWSAALPETLAAMNLMSLLGLHRRYRGALVGHLAALEMTSTAPMRRYANGFRRLGLPEDVARYFDEHVEADAVHEQIAAVDLVGSFVRQEPAHAADVLWGAQACLALDAAMAEALLEQWRGAESGAA